MICLQSVGSSSKTVRNLDAYYSSHVATRRHLASKCHAMNFCMVINFCKNGGKCNFEGCQSHCSCDHGFYGNRCQFIYQSSSPVVTTTFTSATISLPPVTCSVVTRTTNNLNCSISSYPCKHGVCIETPSSIGIGASHVSCYCDADWTGTFCDICCDVDCGNHGNCSVVNGTKQCQCHVGYHGTTCTDTTPELDVSSVTSSGWLTYIIL